MFYLGARVGVVVVGVKVWASPCACCCLVSLPPLFENTSVGVFPPSYHLRIALSLHLTLYIPPCVAVSLCVCALLDSSLFLSVTLSLSLSISLACSPSVYICFVFPLSLPLPCLSLSLSFAPSLSLPLSLFHISLRL